NPASRSTWVPRTAIYTYGGDDSIDGGAGDDEAHAGPGTDSCVGVERPTACETVGCRVAPSAAQCRLAPGAHDLVERLVRRERTADRRREAPGGQEPPEA